VAGTVRTGDSGSWSGIGQLTDHQAELADLLGVDLQVIRSRRGHDSFLHDSFLVEVDQINAVLVDALT
jgi:hypothetical protein